MRVLHISFTSSFSEGASYQENMLADIMSEQGYDVFFWATCLVRDEGKLKTIDPEEKELPSGVHLKRFSYVRVVNRAITERIRKVKDVYKELSRLAPDCIMMHNIQSFTTYDICKYVKDHPQVRLVADSHTDSNNSGRNFFSKYILHRLIYKKIARFAARYIDEFYYVTTDCGRFLNTEYRLNETVVSMTYLPLGGIIPDGETYQLYRQKRRNELKISDDTLLLLHSGKMSPEKKTKSLIDALFDSHIKNIALVLIGDIQDQELKDMVNDLSGKDDLTVRYLGWKTGQVLQEFLCAADLYVQPGSYSVTLQNALCNKCPVLIYPHSIYERIIKSGAGIAVESKDDISREIRILANDRNKLREMKKRAVEYAADYLDYKKQSKLICCQKGAD